MCCDATAQANRFVAVIPTKIEVRIGESAGMMIWKRCYQTRGLPVAVARCIPPV